LLPQRNEGPLAFIRKKWEELAAAGFAAIIVVVVCRQLQFQLQLVSTHRCHPSAAGVIGIVHQQLLLLLQLVSPPSSSSSAVAAPAGVAGIVVVLGQLQLQLVLSPALSSSVGGSSCHCHQFAVVILQQLQLQLVSSLTRRCHPLAAAAAAGVVAGVIIVLGQLQLHVVSSLVLLSSVGRRSWLPHHHL
jgi:hypothetical protein